MAIRSSLSVSVAVQTRQAAFSGRFRRMLRDANRSSKLRKAAHLRRRQYKGTVRMRYVIALDAALRLIEERTVVPPKNSLVAPTLLRSQILSELFASVARGEFDRSEANARLDHMRALKIRLLGDRVLQKVAWDVAEQLGWEDTMQAEYVALTKLQADALVTLDASLEKSLEGVVPLRSFDDMIG